LAPEDTGALAAWLARSTGARAARILAFERLAGGAIQDNRALDVAFDGGRLDGEQRLVLRMSSPGTVQASHDRAGEFALLQAAFAAGVTVPEPLALCEDTSVLGREFFVMRRVDGTGLGPRVVKDRSLGGDREALAGRLGEELARIHSIRPGAAGLEFLGEPPADPARRLASVYRQWLDELGASRPVLEWALRWLDLNAPEPGEIVLCHRDFRTGNYMVDEHGLTAVLDWEFAGWGDPMEDLGWMCSRFWRFGADELEAGGIAGREVLYAGYTAASGRAVDAPRLRYYEVMANLRWAVIALQQCNRFVSGAEAGLELALIGRRVPEMEIEILDLTREAA